MAARRTFGDQRSAQPSPAMIWRTPAAAALRRMVPMLPGSWMRSSTTQSPFCGGAAVSGISTRLRMPPPSERAEALASRRSSTAAVFSDGRRASRLCVSGVCRRLCAMKTCCGCAPLCSSASSRCAPSSTVWRYWRRYLADTPSLARCLSCVLCGEAILFHGCLFLERCFDCVAASFSLR